MHRALIVLAATATLLMSGCGESASHPDSTSASADAPGTAPSSASSTAADEDTLYFGKADSDAINVVVRQAQTAARRATTTRNEERCNASADRGYSAWRACWHGLLDPYAKRLLAVGDEFDSLATRDYPATCVTSLTLARQVFGDFARRVQGLLAGIDSSERAAQVRATKAYNRTLSAIEKGYLKPFQVVTRDCYSPEDLKKINASASAAPDS
jgi:hypothetical protein